MAKRRKGRHSRGRSRRRGRVRSFFRRRWRAMSRPKKVVTSLVLALVALLALLEVAALADNRLHDDAALRNVTVGGIDVGGQSTEEIHTTLATLDDRVGQLPVQFAGNDRSLDVTAADAGLTID